MVVRERRREGGRKGGRERGLAYLSAGRRGPDMQGVDVEDVRKEEREGGREGAREGAREGLLTSAPEEGVQTCRAWTSRT